MIQRLAEQGISLFRKDLIDVYVFFITDMFIIYNFFNILKNKHGDRVTGCCNVKLLHSRFIFYLAIIY